MSASTLDLGLEDTQQVIADAVRAFCRDQCTEQAVRATEDRFPAELWKGLADLGVLGLASPEGEGGAMEMVAALEVLGRAVFPGPLAASFLATQLLEGAERAAVAGGEAVVSVGAPPLLPFAPAARIFLWIEGERAWRAEPAGPVEPVDTLGGEPWGRVRLERTGELLGAARALSVHDVALCAFLCAAARGLVDRTAEHARTRRQFGRAIGEFQAVAHPLADCALQLDGAATLARAAAFRLDTEDPQARASAAAARLAARRTSLQAAYTCHQLFGAVGITLEGPVFHVSRRLVQAATGAPGEAAARRALLARFGP